MANNTVENNNERIRKNKHGVNPESSWISVDNNYALICENNITGNVKKKQKGLRFCFPGLYKKTLISLSDQPIDYKKKSYKSKDNYDIIVDTAIVYKIVDPIMYYKQENALQTLNITMDDIFKRLVAKYSFDELSNMKVDLREDEFSWIIRDLESLKYEYGIIIKDIKIQRPELTNEMKKSREENALVREKNQRNIDIANTEKTISNIKAEAMKVEESAKKDILKEKIEMLTEKIMSFPVEQQAQILKELMREDANITLIENNGKNISIDDIARYATLSNMFNQNQYNNSQANNMPEYDYENDFENEENNFHEEGFENIENVVNNNSNNAPKKVKVIRKKRR